MNPIITMINLPFKYGFSPSKWKQSIQLLLQKDPGIPHIEILSIIQLIEDDLNGYLEIVVGWKSMDHSDTQKLISDDLYGGIWQQNTHAAILSKVLVYEMSTAIKIPYTRIVLDASKCYDRITPQFDSLILKIIGLPPETCISLEKH